ncbi:MAG: EF-hand domain-containing protein [Hellea sp.]
MFFRPKYLLSITAAVLYSSPIHAAPKMDANGDKEISRIEYMSFMSNAFNKEDKNFDGKLTKQEIRDARKERLRESAKTRFKNMDTNNDGSITQQEHDASANGKTEKKTETRLNKADKWFGRMDKDKNGHISRLEFDAYNETQATKAYEKSLKSSEKKFSRLDLDGDGNITEFEYVDKGRDPGSKTSQKSDPMAGLYANETAKPKKRTRRDGNSDGEITKREDREFNAYYFDILDRNKDGVITKKEGRHLFMQSSPGGDLVIKR